MDRDDVIIPDKEVGRALTANGWKQGSVFTFPAGNALAYSLHSDGSPVIESVSTPSSNLWIVTSQTCDIDASTATEPFIEAMPVAITKDQSRARLSYRWFNIGTDNLQVYAMYRTSFQKRSLLEITPREFPGPSKKRSRFKEWILRRASREALPDELVKSFVGPFQRILRDESTQFIDDLNLLVREFRFWPPKQAEAPFDIQLVVLLDSPNDQLTEQQFGIVQNLQSFLNDSLANSGSNIVGIDYYNVETMSLFTVEETFRIDLDVVTYEGEEIDPASPIRAW